MDLNKVFVIGRLTSDPQTRTTPSGQLVASFSLATNRVWRDKNGERKEDTQFHNIVAWARQAEIIKQFTTKGSTLLIEGHLQTRAWQDRDNQNRRTTEIICENLQLGPRPANMPGGGGSFYSKPPEKNSADQEEKSPQTKVEEMPSIDLDDTPSEIKDEDLPF